MRRSALYIVLALTLWSGLAAADSRTDARRYFNAGMAAIRAAEYERGIDNLLRAYELKPHPNVLYNVAQAYTRLGQYASAVQYLEQYLATNPRDAAGVRAAADDARARLRLRRIVDDGMRAVAAGRHLEGIALLEQAYSERPHPNLLYNVARAREELNQLELAVANYKAYLAGDPKDELKVRERVVELQARINARPKTPVVSEPAHAAVSPEQLARMVADLLAQRQATTTAPATPLPDAKALEGPAPQIDPKADQDLYEEVVVTASRRAQSPLDAPNAVTIITAEDIRLSGARAIPELLRRVPGMDVMAMSYSDWNVALRGFNRRIANKLLVLVDGRTAYLDFLGGMAWLQQTYSLEDIARIEVVRGPGSAIYGANAYAGIVNIILKTPEEVDGTVIVAGGGSAEAFRGTYQFGKRFGRFGFRGSVGWEQGNKYDFEYDPNRIDYTQATSDFAGEVDRSIAMLRADVQADVHFSDQKLSVGAGLARGYTEFYGVSALRNQQSDGFETNVRLAYESDLFSVLVFWNRLRTEAKPQFYATGMPDLGSRVAADLFVIEPVFRPTFQLAGEHQMVIGAEYRHKFIEWNYLDESHADPFFAAFIQDQWRIHEVFTFLLSYRLDVHPLIGVVRQPDLKIPGSPRIAFIFHPAERQSVRLSLGTAFRQATQAENYLRLSAASPVAGVAVRLRGDPDLEPEDIITAELGYLFQSDFGEFEVVSYVNRVNNLIQRTPLIPTDPSEGFDPQTNAFIGADSFSINDDRVFLAVGGEIAGRVYPLDGLDIGASYAFQYIFDQDSGERFTNSPLHKASLWGQLRLGIGLDIGLSFHFTSQQDWIEPAFDQDDPSGFRTDPQHVDHGFIMNARIGYRLFDDRLELSVVGTNLFDFGGNRHQEHPFANRLQARVFGALAARF